MVNQLNDRSLTREVLKVFNKFGVIDVECAETIDFVLFITLKIKLKRRFDVSGHTELKLYLLASGQMQGLPDEIILRF